MIVPMKKVSLITLGEERDACLHTLRKLGLVQIEIREGRGERLASYREKIARPGNGSDFVAA